MNANFAASLALVLKIEGGYSNNKKDPGGATNKGITQATYDKWRRSHGLPTQDVRLITGIEVEAIYHAQFWLPIHGDELPSGVDYCVFDFAVNSGPHEADVCLQRAIESLQSAADVVVDGVIGPKTLAAVRACDPRWLINSVCAQRLTFMKEHCDWADFGKGWEPRVNSVELNARGMVA